MAPASVLGIFLEVALAFSGLVLLWRHAACPAARRSPPPARLEPWPGSAADLLLLLLLAVAGALVLSIAADFGLRKAGVGQTARMVWGAVALQGGLLAGIGIFWAGLRGRRPGTAAAPAEALRSGVATFLAALPVVFAVVFAWQVLLDLCGVPARKQDVVALFEQIRSPALRVVFAAAAVAIAPIAEEIIFRAGIFRILRGAVPRPVAIGASALLFGAAHLLPSPADGLASFAPLVALGVIFCLAYERTGRIGTTVAAHALFNLNTLAMLLLGLSP